MSCNTDGETTKKEMLDRILDLFVLNVYCARTHQWTAHDYRTMTNVADLSVKFLHVILIKL